MNTKMILEIAGAKPLATLCNTGKADGVKGLVAEKRPVAVCENLEVVNQPTSEGLKLAGLGEGMWKGVFGG